MCVHWMVSLCAVSSYVGCLLGPRLLLVASSNFHKTKKKTIGLLLMDRHCSATAYVAEKNLHVLRLAASDAVFE